MLPTTNCKTIILIIFLVDLFFPFSFSSPPLIEGTLFAVNLFSSLNEEGAHPETLLSLFNAKLSFVFAIGATLINGRWYLFYHFTYCERRRKRRRKKKQQFQHLTRDYGKRKNIYIYKFRLKSYRNFGNISFMFLFFVGIFDLRFTIKRSLKTNVLINTFWNHIVLIENDKLG